MLDSLPQGHQLSQKIGHGPSDQAQISKAIRGNAVDDFDDIIIDWTIHSGLCFRGWWIQEAAGVRKAAYLITSQDQWD